jgi:glycosyltransferase involved in cell wall biosynthesis
VAQGGRSLLSPLPHKFKSVVKVLILHQYFNTPANPGSIRTYDLLKHWKKQGMTATVVTTNYYLNYEFKGLYKKVNILDSEVFVLNTRFNQKSSKFTRIAGFLLYVLFSFFISLFQRFDVLFATSTPITIAIPALLTSLIRRKPLVFEVRDLWPLIPYKLGYLKNKRVVSLLFKLEKLAYTKSRHVVFLSTDMMKLSKERYPDIRTPFSVIENMASIDLFEKADANDFSILNNEELVAILKDREALKIGYLGTIGFVNNCEYLVLLAEKIKALGVAVKVVIVGDGSEKGDVLHLVKKKGLEDVVVLFEPMAKQNIPTIYKNVNYSISTVRDVPELASNSANKFFDSLAAGTRILINHEGWQADFIRQHGVGFVLKYDLSNVAEFVAYHKEQLQVNDTERIVELAKTTFSSKVQADKYVAIFETAASK